MEATLETGRGAMAAWVRRNRTEMGPGCDARCIRMAGRGYEVRHDSQAHEAYGRTLRVIENRHVTTRGVTVDVDTGETMVDGRRVHMTATELEIMALLFRRAGKIVRHADAMKRVWGHEYTEDEAHMWRVNVCRIRAKLRPYSDVIETVTGTGYRVITDAQYAARTAAAV